MQAGDLVQLLRDPLLHGWVGRVASVDGTRVSIEFDEDRAGTLLVVDEVQFPGLLAAYTAPPVEPEPAEVEAETAPAGDGTF